MSSSNSGGTLSRPKHNYFLTFSESHRPYFLNSLSLNPFSGDTGSSASLKRMYPKTFSLQSNRLNGGLNGFAGGGITDRLCPFKRSTGFASIASPEDKCDAFIGYGGEFQGFVVRVIYTHAHSWYVGRIYWIR